MNNQFEKACKFAIECHSNQKRKDGSIYILHPFEVVTIASTMTKDEDVLIAAILHDTVEDANIKIEEIINLFGKRVGYLVDYETEPKYPNLSKEESWMLRKQGALKKLELSNDISFKILYLSDKLANIRSLYRDYKLNGISSFDKFNIKDIDIQSWYYYSILERLKELQSFEAYKEFEDKLNYIFKETKVRNNEKNNNHI